MTRPLRLLALLACLAVTACRTYPAAEVEGPKRVALVAMVPDVVQFKFSDIRYLVPAGVGG